MASSGIYKLSINDNIRDEYFTANALLKKRLDVIRATCSCGKLRKDCGGVNKECKRPVDVLVGDVEKTHVFFMRNSFKPYVNFAFEYQIAQQVGGNAQFGGNIRFNIPQFGDFFTDMAFHVRMEGLRSSVANDTAYCCDFPGHRIMQEVSFMVDQNPLDRYYPDNMNFHYAYMDVNKKPAWLRCVGQQTPTPTSFVVPTSGGGSYTEVRYIAYGYQTPKPVHDVIDLWIPLIFWFNEDVSYAFPSVAVTWGQRFLDVSIASADKLFKTTSGAPVVVPRIVKAELYVNNIFVAKEMQAIFIKSMGMQLVRLHLFQESNVGSGEFSVRVDNMKFYIEQIYCGVRPNVNVTGPSNFTDWYRYHVVDNGAGGTVAIPVAVPNPAPPPLFSLKYAIGQTKQYVASVDGLSMTNKGNVLYPTKEVVFYNAYTALTYGNLSSPEDPGMMMLPFTLKPMEIQPAGYINLSEARMSYINGTSLLPPGSPGKLVVVARAINMLIINRETAALRYAV